MIKIMIDGDMTLKAAWSRIEAKLRSDDAPERFIKAMKAMFFIGGANAYSQVCDALVGDDWRGLARVLDQMAKDVGEQVDPDYMPEAEGNA